MQTRIRSLRGMAAALVAAATFAAPGMSGAQLVTGLQGSSGSTVGPDGALYVPEGAPGAGRITRVDPVTGTTSPVVSGLPTSIIGYGGPVDVAWLDGTAYALVSLVGDPLLPFIVSDPDLELAVDGIYRIDGPSDWTIVADLGAWSASHPPTGFDFFLVNGVQFAIETFRGGFLVTDGHHNRILHVTSDGEISEFATFGNTVPTGLEVQGDTVYVAESGPSPHFPEDGKVVAVNARSRAVTEVASGAPLAVDVERGRGESLYVLSQGLWAGTIPGDPGVPNTGSLMRVNGNGVTTLVTPLNLPSSLEFIGNTAYVVTLVGEIWAIPDVGAPPFGRP